MIYWLYERWLARHVTVLTEHLCFMLTESDMRSAPEKLAEVTRWCLDLGIAGVMFHISTADPSRIDPFLPFICRVADMGELHLHAGNREEVTGSGSPVTLPSAARAGRRSPPDHIIHIH